MMLRYGPRTNKASAGKPAGLTCCTTAAAKDGNKAKKALAFGIGTDWHGLASLPHRAGEHDDEIHACGSGLGIGDWLCELRGIVFSGGIGTSIGKTLGDID